jgi:RNA polymerase sigma-70 factor (ECF subfamily)
LGTDKQPLLRSLIRGCLKNDRKSQRDLYQHFYAYGLSICFRYSDDREEAVELLNEAFMKIFLNLKKFDLTKPFTPWLRKILINTCINNFKKKKIAFTEELEELKSHQGSEDILAGISYQEILGFIRKLSPAYRAVFNLYVIEGYKHEEISKMLNISVGTSKSNLAKAKNNMQIILRDYFQEDYERSKQG